VTAPAATIGGVALPFCAMNASGVWSTTAAELLALAQSGSGAVVFRSTTAHPFLHPAYRSLHNPGYDRFVPLLAELRPYGKPLVPSVAGATADEYVNVVRAFAEAGADLVELDLADPYVTATLTPWEEAAALGQILAKIRAAAACPLVLRCPERLPLPVADLRRVLLDTAIEGVVLANTFVAFEKFVVARAGAGAPAVITVGGVASGYDVWNTLRKGAVAVQVGAALAREGPAVFARLAREYAVHAQRAGA
jgi:dihydroorotate dehydrogenase (fumarate)